MVKGGQSPLGPHFCSLYNILSMNTDTEMGEKVMEKTTATMDLDKLTLELLMNKTTYKKYVEKTDPKKFDERQQFLARVRKYRARILSLTEDYLENPDIQVSLDMNQAFDDYMKSAIRYLEDMDIQSRPFEDIQLFAQDE